MTFPPVPKPTSLLAAYRLLNYLLLPFTFLGPLFPPPCHTSLTCRAARRDAGLRGSCMARACMGSDRRSGRGAVIVRGTPEEAAAQSRRIRSRSELS